MLVNINQICKVVLTHQGALTYNDYYNKIDPYQKYHSTLYENSTLHTPLWDLMNIFGQQLFQGSYVQFVDNVIEIPE